MGIRERMAFALVLFLLPVAASMTVRVPDASFVTSTRTAGAGVAAAAGGAAAAGSGFGRSCRQPPAANATRMTKMYGWRFMRG